MGHEGGDRVDAAFIFDHRFDQTRNAATNPEVRHPLARLDAVSRRAHIVLHVLLQGCINGAPPLHGKLQHRHAGDQGVGPMHHGRVAVLTQHISVDGSGRHIQVLRQAITETDGVERAARANRAARRHAKALHRYGGHDIHRVGGKQQHGVGRGLEHLGQDAIHDVQILVQQLQPGLAGLQAGPRRNHHHGRARQIGIAAFHHTR